MGVLEAQGTRGGGSAFAFAPHVAALHDGLEAVRVGREVAAAVGADGVAHACLEVRSAEVVLARVHVRHR
eukprot:2375351-Pyramimonas_sp.AAC.1